jgi:DNA-binding response OmpR family regulator
MPLDRPRLLLVEDDQKLCRLLKDYLEPLGYEVEAVHDGRAGLARALEEPRAAVILDVMLPGMSGLDVLRELRKTSHTPVLMLTALGDEVDRITGLEVGADDYLPKTFSTRELLARLRAVLRRSATVAEQKDSARPATVSVGSLWLDPGARSAALGETPLVLTRVEYDLLLALARAVGRVCTREHLLLAAADRDFETFDRSIDVHISALRRKLADDSREPRFIETVRGLGYRMRRPSEVA